MTTLLWALATLVTVEMGVFTLSGAIRWSRLDRGARLIVVAIAIHFAMAVGSTAVVAMGHSNRLLNEVSHLFGTAVALMGFASWQPTTGDRRVVLVALGIFLPLAILGNTVQGLGWGYSTFTNSLSGFTFCATAGYTLVRLVFSTPGAWSDYLWFWVCVALLLDFGTEVLLVPVYSVLRTNTDALLSAYVLHLLGSAAAYAIMSWAMLTRKGCVDRGVGGMSFPSWAERGR